ncbi:MAG: hypothetical protein QXQ02_03500, partial [Halobacteria archaeon]
MTKEVTPTLKLKLALVFPKIQEVCLEDKDIQELPDEPTLDIPEGMELITSDEAAHYRYLMKNFKRVYENQVNSEDYHKRYEYDESNYLDTFIDSPNSGKWNDPKLIAEEQANWNPIQTEFTKRKLINLANG